MLEANIDDLNPQVFGYVMDRLLEEGALDAFGMPVQMKKNRPGMLLTVLCRPEDASKLTHLIFTETSTLGVRQREEKRRGARSRMGNRSDPLGRCTTESREHEWHGNELCSGIRGLPPHRD